VFDFKVSLGSPLSAQVPSATDWGCKGVTGFGVSSL